MLLPHWYTCHSSYFICSLYLQVTDDLLRPQPRTDFCHVIPPLRMRKHFRETKAQHMTQHLAVARARPGFEPGTSRTLSENHTPRPTSHKVVVFLTTIWQMHVSCQVLLNAFIKVQSFPCVLATVRGSIVIALRTIDQWGKCLGVWRWGIHICNSCVGSKGTLSHGMKKIHTLRVRIRIHTSTAGQPILEHISTISLTKPGWHFICPIHLIHFQPERGIFSLTLDWNNNFFISSANQGSVDTTENPKKHTFKICLT